MWYNPKMTERSRVINRRQAMGAIAGGALAFFTGQKVQAAESDTDGTLRIVAAESLATFRMFVDTHRQLQAISGREPSPLEGYRPVLVFAVGQILSGVDPLSPDFWEGQGGSEQQPNATPNPTPARTSTPGKSPIMG